MLERTLTWMGLPVNPKTLIILVYALVVAAVCIVSFGSLVFIKLRNPMADVDIFLNIFLTSLGNMVGILTGLLGLNL